MLFLEESPQKIDLRHYRHRRADETDTDRIFRQDVTVTTDGIPKIVYFQNALDNPNAIAEMLAGIRYDRTTRTSGLVTESRIFGYSPRNGIRNAPCRATSLNRDVPAEYRHLKSLAAKAAEKYHQVNSSLAEQHKSLTTERVLPAYRLGESMFTSGIINHNNPLNYHFDSGNYKGVWSAMFGFKRGVRGGYLSCPEYNLSLEIANGSLTLFDGQAILHGVTPIKKVAPKAKRYTIVFYSLRGMWSCEEPFDELNRMRKARMKMEQNKVTKNGTNRNK